MLPAGETFRTPGQVARSINGDEFRLYELIWQRFMASQMTPAIFDTTTVDFLIDGREGHKSAGDPRQYLFRSTGSIVKLSRTARRTWVEIQPT